MHRNNTSLPNFIQIGRRQGEWRLNNLFLTYNVRQPWLWMGMANGKLNCLFIRLLTYLQY